jgi:hypothetical protein
MAEFKIHYGSKEDLGRQPLHTGYMYFTPEDGSLYIDSKWQGIVSRICLNPVKSVVDLFKSYESIYEFPNIGEENFFYIDKSNGDIFLWRADGRPHYTSIGVANRDTIYGGGSEED